MKAVVYDRYGPLEVLRIGEVERPTPREDELLVRVRVARSSGSGWQQVPAPDPGTGDKTLGGISATGDAAWAVGYFKTDTGRSPLIEVREPR